MPAIHGAMRRALVLAVTGSSTRAPVNALTAAHR
jgi:hypothetical protein